MVTESGGPRAVPLLPACLLAGRAGGAGISGSPPARAGLRSLALRSRTSRCSTSAGSLPPCSTLVDSPAVVPRSAAVARTPRPSGPGLRPGSRQIPAPPGHAAGSVTCRGGDPSGPSSSSLNPCVLASLRRRPDTRSAVRRAYVGGQSVALFVGRTAGGSPQGGEREPTLVTGDEPGPVAAGQSCCRTSRRRPSGRSALPLRWHGACFARPGPRAVQQ